MVYWVLKYLIIGPIVKAIFRPWIVGRANIPPSGAAVLASNHLSVSDSIFLPLMIDRPMSFLAKSDYFTGRGIKGWATRVFMKGTGQIPIDRTGGKASEASLNTGLQVLGRGDLLGIYPEGTRSPDGKLYRGRTGLARMALTARVPVIPVVMIGTDDIMPIGRSIPRVGRVGMVIGEPLDFTRFHGMESDRFVLRSVTDEIMVALQRMGEQEYEDVYASTVKDRRPASRV
ncbi:1-acyl-sn-glycerol-3-phosphate acyltransferase [Microbacterium sp. EYE_5]|uniref:lysophospholipid acyltransferase family protein n=1 Tax=unclassified Microbacterium TaxID=2609290 RepID=UPI0020032288|nr:MULTISPECIES: lysophospholipid acyltransferase family protein [unclassified Microbacterium]MCK6080432.1 1-acyl-sn-glycerol-3-phosphate acyltransferase [Microbacterium sp. EYE_382]MCK6085703.1 1-acyl-sn-glycerol-3-phosphate acyltransferase [Microbacterium sp. EYE_384]MCK6124799.1 1-acyl-sn-glycerol-3-phosphate acyltransferase [Microbacterium sp. EYE_80]MCK6127708.1 1-acyl-sn-glycerol-3-phosphate acyltransferase [Microbacterium sp. EYE_79]MCK6141387.1 1-acyl-sn-glycerol-3-phosphate acyltransf